MPQFVVWVLFWQVDWKLRPVVCASRALHVSTAKKNYSVTWTVTHFCSYMYLYGSCLAVLTDHSAVKVVLETPNPTGKQSMLAGGQDFMVEELSWSTYSTMPARRM